MVDPVTENWWAFLGLTVVVFGGAAFMMGRALAETWRPFWHTIAYGFLLGVGDRLFHNFFFAGQVLDPLAYVRDTAVLIVIGAFAFRLTLVRKMTTQYPWLYVRSGLMGWKNINGSSMG